MPGPLNLTEAIHKFTQAHVDPQPTCWVAKAVQPAEPGISLKGLLILCQAADVELGAARSPRSLPADKGVTVDTRNARA